MKHRVVTVEFIVTELSAALVRFERVMAQRFPSVLETLRPGLDDTAISALRAAISPMLLPAQVEEFYRWRGGDGFAGVFGGWSMRDPDNLVRWYRFEVDELRSPPAWLPVFNDQMVNIVTLDLPGRAPSDESVWYGHTHDCTVHRLFDSIACLVDVVSDAAEAGALALIDDQFGLPLEDHDGMESFAEQGWTNYRLRRGAGLYRWPEPPPGTSMSRYAEPGWPSDWLAALGVDESATQLRGATHSVTE